MVCALDREGFDDALRCQRVDHVLVDVEIAESQGIPVWEYEWNPVYRPARCAHRAVAGCAG